MAFYVAWHFKNSGTLVCLIK